MNTGNSYVESYKYTHCGIVSECPTCGSLTDFIKTTVITVRSSYIEQYTHKDDKLKCVLCPNRNKGWHKRLHAYLAEIHFGVMNSYESRFPYIPTTVAHRRKQIFELCRIFDENIHDRLDNVGSLVIAKETRFFDETINFWKVLLTKTK